jgi:beta-N-acetylhexosaminidase
MNIQLDTMKEMINETIQAMTLEQKVGLMCIVGISDNLQVDAAFYESLLQHHYGGIGLFPYNINNAEQVAQISDDLQAFVTRNQHPAPFCISIDEEGGTLSNFTEFFPSAPGNCAIGLKNDPNLAFLTGRLIGSQLYSLGIMLDWSPVLDVNTNPLNPVIGVRSYGENPLTVAEYGSAFIKGMRESGVLTTAKHFPGHGDVAEDSHVELPSCELTLEQLYEKTLLPFQYAIDAGVNVIMMAHLLFPNIPESNQLPASLSPFFIEQLLRKELGFNGVVCTDDIEMHAIKNNFTPEEAGVLAVLAGNDQILMCITPDFQHRVYEGIVQAVKKGFISEKRIDLSIERILKFNAEMKQCREHANPVPETEWEPLALSIAEASIVVERDPMQLLPLSNRQYLLILPKLQKLTQADTTYGQELSLAKWLNEKNVRFETLYISMEPTDDEIEEVKRKMVDTDVLIQVMLNAHIFQNQLEMARICAQTKPHICLILRNPYDAEYLPLTSTVVKICSTTNESMKAFVQQFTAIS